MRIAENMSAVSAMMSPFEKREGFLADGGIAYYRVRVGFPMFTGWWTSDWGQIVRGYGIIFSHLSKLFTLLAIGSRASAYGSGALSAFQTVRAAMQTSRRRERR